MRKALFIIGGISLAGILIFPLEDIGNANNYFSGVGVCAFLGAGINLIAGVLLLLISIGAKEVRPYGAACLIVAGLLMLCCFTLCSNTHTNMGHM